MYDKKQNFFLKLTIANIMDNQFLTAAINGPYDRYNVTTTANGAKAYRTAGSELSDQFSAASGYRGRSLDTIFLSQEALVKEEPLSALQFVFYNRLITRKVKLVEEAGEEGSTTDKVQYGQGQRDESFKRFLWYAEFQPAVFYKNLWLMLTVGSMKDFWDLMLLADKSQVNLDHKQMYEVYTNFMELYQYTDLCKKYLPTIRPLSKQTTGHTKMRNILAHQYCKYVGITTQQYRQIKASGTAHQWQQLISRKKGKDINFSLIPGKALTLLVSGKFLANHELDDSYMQWIDAQPVAKFTGYPYELLVAYNKARSNKALIHTVDKQFEGLIKLAKENNENQGIVNNVWCALDTSGSMSTFVANSNKVQAIDVAKSLAIYFSTLNTGAFHKNVIMFDDTSTVKQLNGSFTEMVNQIPDDAMGGTNFQSVIDEIIRIRVEKPKIPLSNFPQTLIVVSDMQFNPAYSRYYSGYTESDTNHEVAVKKMSQHFPADFMKGFKFVWWCVEGGDNDSYEETDFPDSASFNSYKENNFNVASRLEDLGTYLYSGFDGAVITKLLGGNTIKEYGVAQEVPSMHQVIHDALNQEVLSLVRI